jgi:hypothetical protein
MTTDTLLPGFSIEVAGSIPDPNGGKIIQYAIVPNYNPDTRITDVTLDEGTLFFSVVIPEETN